MDPWPRVDVLVDQAESVSDLRHHRLHLYAAWRWRAMGRPVRAELVALEREAAARRLAMPLLARRVREACDGPIVLLKGADVGALYPAPGLRPSADLDLLVPDAEAVHRALLEHGFVVTGRDLASGAPHLDGLSWPGLRGEVEIHGAPKWPFWLEPPTTRELLDDATEQSHAGEGILALSPGHRLLVLLAHTWDEVPNLGHVVDLLLAADRVEPKTLERLLAQHGLDRLWRFTQQVAASVFTPGAQRTSLRARVVARNLVRMRQGTVLGARLADALVPTYALPPHRAAAASARAVTLWLRPNEGETWSSKLRRTRRLLRRSLSPVAQFDWELDAESRRRRSGELRPDDPSGGA
jgi:Uncharacterised nucleotidyltransferase